MLALLTVFHVRSIPTGDISQQLNETSDNGYPRHWRQSSFSEDVSMVMECSSHDSMDNKLGESRSQC